MAKSDFTPGQDRNLGEGITAAEVLSESTRGASPDAESRAAAHAAGVSHPAYVDYAAALEAHEAREDIEPLAARRAREYGADFDAAEFMRFVPGQPGPGSVNGQAPKPGAVPGDEYDLTADNDGDGVVDGEDADPQDPEVTEP